MVHFDLQTDLKPKTDDVHAKHHREVVLFWKIVAVIAVSLLLIFALN